MTLKNDIKMTLTLLMKKPLIFGYFNLININFELYSRKLHMYSLLFMWLFQNNPFQIPNERCSDSTGLISQHSHSWTVQFASQRANLWGAQMTGWLFFFILSRLPEASTDLICDSKHLAFTKFLGSNGR